jgi:hypothetical protein
MRSGPSAPQQGFDALLFVPSLERRLMLWIAARAGIGHNGLTAGFGTTKVHKIVVVEAKLGQWRWQEFTANAGVVF